MSKPLRIASLLSLIGLLLGGLLFLIYKTQALDANLTHKADSILHVFEEIDTGINLDVLRTYIGNGENSDSYIKELPTLKQNQVKFTAAINELGIPGLNQESEKLQEMLNNKQQMISNFDQEHRTLLTALELLPKQLQALRKSLDGQQKQALDETGNIVFDDKNNELIALRETVSTLSDELMGMVAFNKPGSRENSQQLLEKLQSTPVPQSPEIKNQLSSMQENAGVILQNWMDVNKELNSMQLASVKIDEQLHVLEHKLEEGFAGKVTAQGGWGNVLIAYSAALLALLSFLGWRLWKSFRALDQANATLEDRVNKRTEALTLALGELKESQIQLIQSEKMASLGQMVAGVAHEINTPLAYVKGGLEIVSTRVNDVDSLINETHTLMNLMAADPEEDNTSEEEIAERFATVQEISSAFVETETVNELKGLVSDGLHGIEQIAEIVINMKDFSRLDRARMDQFNINEGIESTLKIARNLVKHRHLAKVLGDVPLINCSPSQINQVLLNLINNACHATNEENGRVTIVTRGVDGGVSIEVSDNGKGISEADLPRIFDPFFTTKKVGEGTGLGLSIVQRIIKDHGGDIQVQSSAGMGTRFDIWLPNNVEEKADEMRVAA